MKRLFQLVLYPTCIIAQHAKHSETDTSYGINEPGALTVEEVKNIAKRCDPVIRDQNANNYWDNLHEEELKQREKLFEFSVSHNQRAKNIVLFVAPGLNTDSLTAARIHSAQIQKKGCGEETQLNVDKFPWSGFSKTYAVNRQTPDAAASANAIFSGVKSGFLTLGQNGKARYNESEVDNRNCVIRDNILHVLKNKRGYSNFRAGIVTNRAFDSATPAALYACVNSRFDRSKVAKAFEDRLRRNVIDLSFSGGRRFLPDMLTNNRATKYVDNKRGFSTLSVDDTNRPIVGAFAADDMPFEDNREHMSQPSLKEMAVKATELLQASSKDGFFLMVEGGLIAKAHQENYGLRALEEIHHLDETIQAVINTINDPDERAKTLIVVAPSHGSPFTFGSYGRRAHTVTNFAKPEGYIVGKLSTGDAEHTAAGYYTGPGSLQKNKPDSNKCDHGLKTEEELKQDAKRYGFPQKDVIDKMSFNQDTKQMTKYNKRMTSTVPMNTAANSGEDVPIFSQGPFSHLLSGTHEQSYIAHVMHYAACTGHVIETLRRKGDPLRHCQGFPGFKG